MMHVQFCNEAKSCAYWLVNETLWYETETRPRHLIFSRRRDRDRDLPTFPRDRDKTETFGNYVSRPRRRDRDYIPDIHYQMLKHLSSEVLNTLLGILNDIWLTGIFPSSWRQSYVVPIPKPGKDTSNPTNYHPIALASCVCKVMEWMVNNRLVRYLERNKIITPTQSGFCKGRSITDQLVSK